MAKRTKKVGIVGKYGTRYGASLRKLIKKIEVSQHKKYTGPSGKDDMKRVAAGIWQCKSLRMKIAGGAYVPETAGAASFKIKVKSLRDQKEGNQTFCIPFFKKS